MSYYQVLQYVNGLLNMQKTIFTKQAIAFFISLFLLSPFKSSGQLILLDEAVPFKPTTFYIADVADERADKVAIAQLVGKGNASQATDLQGGAAVAVNRFITRNLPKDTSLRAVVMSIKEFRLNETALPNGSVDGRINLHLSFGLRKDYGVEHLVDYPGALHYIRPAGSMATVEGRIRSILKSGLVYFNNWMNNNVSVNRKLAGEVKISFTDYSEQPEGDTIYYAVNRPLAWADFQSRMKPPGRFEAEVMPGIGYNQQAEVIKGTIRVNVVMKTYLPKSAARANATGRNDYALNHEQRHFDITKIITEQFKQKVLCKPLTPDTFEAFINMQYLDSYRDMHAMQKAYDTETNHGANRFAQESWNNRIDKELKTR
jgi:hypothetical protein